MLEKLKKLNPDIALYSVHDREFREYGRVLNIKTDRFLEAAANIILPKEGTSYVPSAAELQTLPETKEAEREYFGNIAVQAGYCCGKNSRLNAWEWHISSEVNIAATPLVLILGRRQDVVDGKIDSSKAKAFYLDRGDAVEVYSTSLHYCPCQVTDSGFGCVVILPEKTNTPLKEPVCDKLLFRNNKWIIAHIDNRELTDIGVAAGVTGTNYEIKR